MQVDNKFDVEKLQAQFQAAVADRSAMRDAADAADFRSRATLDACKHAISLQETLHGNRLFEEAERFSPFFYQLVESQKAAQAGAKAASEAFGRASQLASELEYHLRPAVHSAANTFEVP